MKNDTLIRYASNDHLNHLNDFVDAIYNSKLKYSLLHLPFAENNLTENIEDILQKSILICQRASIESSHHFKKIYVYDLASKSVHIDWRMSKEGFNLMIMQLPSLNKNTALWLWKLACM